MLNSKLLKKSNRFLLLLFTSIIAIAFVTLYLCLVFNQTTAFSIKSITELSGDVFKINIFWCIQSMVVTISSVRENETTKSEAAVTVGGSAVFAFFCFGVCAGLLPPVIEAFRLTAVFAAAALAPLAEGAGEEAEASVSAEN